MIRLVFHLQLDMDEPFKVKTKRKLKSKESIFHLQYVEITNYA